MTIVLIVGTEWGHAQCAEAHTVCGGKQYLWTVSLWARLHLLTFVLGRCEVKLLLCGEGAVERLVDNTSHSY